MTHGRHTRIRPHHWVAGVVAIVLVVSLLGVLGWAYRTQAGGSGTEEAASSPRPSGTGGTGGTGDPLDTCRAVWRAQSAALTANGHSLQQWQVHVDAMNRLVAGEITLAQATAFWNRTRVGAASRVARAETADGAYADVAPQCSTAVARADPAAVPPVLRDCRAGVRARDRAIDAGVVAIATWKHHITDMEMLRAGQITAAQATRMWLMSWRQGVRQLDRFTNLRRDAADVGGC